MEWYVLPKNIEWGGTFINYCYIVLSFKTNPDYVSSGVIERKIVSVLRALDFNGVQYFNLKKKVDVFTNRKFYNIIHQ